MRHIVEEQFGIDVRTALGSCPRQLPSRYLYDELGSALFEAICRLPWYPITRAEERLLKRHRSEIFQHVAPSQIVELGSGSGDKLKLLLEAPEAGACIVDVHLVDVSPAALAQAGVALAGIETVHVIPHEAAYEDGLGAAARSFAPSDAALVLFLGSNIGNFDPDAGRRLIRTIRDALRPGDALLLGVDLVKDRERLELAYDDPVGVTAAFNRNLLARLNRELGANFNVGAFAHRAIWNEEESRVEMHLAAEQEQHVIVPGADFAFTLAAGETIWTESSYKFTPESIQAMLEAGGFRVGAQWLDVPASFALTLADAV